MQERVSIGTDGVNAQFIPTYTQIKFGETSEKKVAMLSRDNSLTISDLAKNLGVSTRSIERNIQKMQDDGRLRRIGAAKGGYLEVVLK